MAQPRRIEGTRQAFLLGVKVDDVEVGELVAHVAEAIQAGNKLIVANVNVLAMNLAFEQPWLRQFFNQCGIVLCDGFGVKWGAAIARQTIANRVSSPDWIDPLASMCAERGFSMFLLGTGEGVAARAGRRLTEQHPGLRLVGEAHGYFDRTRDGAQNLAIVDRINHLRPDVLLVAMGMPIQERWLLENWDGLDVRVAVTVGALLDYIAGEKRRPPRVLTDHGLEWAGRILIEPRRLWRRYLVGNPLFLWRMVWARLGVLRVPQPTATPRPTSQP